MASTDRRAEAIWIESKGYWQVKVQRDGVRKGFTSSTAGRKGKREAEGKADQWLGMQTDAMRLQAAWTAFIDHQRSHFSTSNWKLHDWAGRMYIMPTIGNKLLDRITPMNWQACVDAAAAKGLSHHSCLDIRLSISAFIAFARRNRWTIDRLERGDIVIPDSAPKPNKQILQPDDLKVLFTADTILITRAKKPKPSFYIHAWRLLAITGLRRGELTGLRNDDIVDNMIRIRRSINNFDEQTTGKNDNARRNILLSRHAIEVLEAQRAMLRRMGIISPWVFPDMQGGRSDPNAIYRRWYVYRRQYGIKASLHGLRHTFISAVKADMPEELLKPMVGHAPNMDTFGVYGHQVDGDMQRTAAIIDDVFDRFLGKVGG